jgi:ATP-dependent protease ClpP protease subunit
MTVTVVPRSGSGAFPDTTLVHLDGPIDPGAPDRLAAALAGASGRIAVWLNSPGGNLFAGMQLGRIIRRYGAWTHIIDSRTFLPGECYSACALAFLGGVHRFNTNGARYGVHRASLAGGATTGERDLARDLSVAVGSYIREMAIDARLLDLWEKAAPDEMYVLSPREAGDLGVVDNGRRPPEWRMAGGTVLEGRQSTTDGTGVVTFSCDRRQTVLGSVYEGGKKGDAIAAGRWSHVLMIDGYEARPLRPLDVSSKDGVVRSRFVLSPDLVLLAMSASQIGVRMVPSSRRSSALGYGVDVDDRSAPVVERFLRNCLREQVK